MSTNEKKCSILIVDDEPKNIQLIGNILKEYEVEFATCGKEALEWIGSKKFDLILLDIMMPDMDGFEVCKRLKADEKTKDTPVIFITARREEDDEFRGLELGAIDYITKPLKLPIVKRRVKNHLKLQSLMSELTEKNKELETSNEELSEVNRLKNKFIGFAAHDLRTPVSGIRGLSNLLLKSKLTEEKQKTFLENIHQVATEMLVLIDDLLDISMIESGKLEIRLSRGHMGKLVAGRVRLNEIIAEKKGIAIETELSETPTIQFDGPRMAQVIDNLMSNAIKFSPPGTTIHVSLTQREDMLRVSVRDEGPGVGRVDHENLFDEFQRLDIEPSAGEKSSGLGLAIVKKIISAHNGLLEVESDPGGGAEFAFMLPIHCG